MKQLTLTAVILGSLFAVPVQAIPIVQLTDFRVINAPSVEGLNTKVETIVTGINNNGQVVGWAYQWKPDYWQSLNLYQSFVEDNGNFTFLTTPSITRDFTPTGINDSGQIVGTGGFESKGGFTDASVGLNPYAINNSGQVVSLGLKSFLFSNGNYTWYNEGTTARGINDLGQVIGFDVSDKFFIESNNNYSWFSPPDAGLNSRSFPTGINNTGQIVGYTLDAYGGFLGSFIGQSNGNYTWLTVPNVNNGSILLNGINNNGQVVGYFLNYSGTPLGSSFIASIPVSPVPEPESLTLMLLGLGLIGVTTRRNKVLAR